jgi:hypothetical protein
LREVFPSLRACYKELLAATCLVHRGTADSAAASAASSMLYFRHGTVSSDERRWGAADTLVIVEGTAAGDPFPDWVKLRVTGLRPFVDVVLPTESPPFDEARAEELTNLLAPVLASAAGYRGRRLRLSLCTQALERTRVEYEQPQGPARTLRIVFNCSSVAAEVARVLEAPEAAASEWTYQRSIDAEGLVAVLGDGRGGIRVISPETARDPAACFAARTGVAAKRWCAVETAWPDCEHEHDDPVAFGVDAFNPIDQDDLTLREVTRRRVAERAEEEEALKREHQYQETEKREALESLARRAYDARHFTLLDSLLCAFPHLDALFDDDDPTLREVKRRRVAGCADEEAPRREQQYQENEKREALESLARRAYDARLFKLFDHLLRAFPHLHTLFGDDELKAGETKLRQNAKDRRMLCPFRFEVCARRESAQTRPV